MDKTDERTSYFGLASGVVGTEEKRNDEQVAWFPGASRRANGLCRHNTSDRNTQQQYMEDGLSMHHIIQLRDSLL